MSENKISVEKEYIYKRKSIRKYKKTSIDEAMTNDIKKIICSARQLYDKCKIDIKDISDKQSGHGASYYITFTTGDSIEELVNVGFVGEQINLYLASRGLGACWQMKKPYTVTMAYGVADEDLYREKEDFKRKPLTEISEGYDRRLEAARLAPSGYNLQGWYYVVSDNRIHVYAKINDRITGIIKDKPGYISVGIALCHIYEESEAFSFIYDSSYPTKKGYKYIGTVV